MLTAVLASGASWALHPSEHGQVSHSQVAQRAFFKPELYISSRNAPMEEVRSALSTARESAFTRFFERYGEDFYVYLDPRSGAATNLQGPIPLLPGNGVGNRVTLDSLVQQLGRPVNTVDEDTVGELVLQFAQQNQDVLGIDASQLGKPRVTQVTESLWQLHFPQEVHGIPVRHGRLAASISHGNLVVIGTETWGNVKTPLFPLVSADQALTSGLLAAGLTFSPQNFWREPSLELVPYARPQFQIGTDFASPANEGYGHKLAWVYGFHEDGAEESWEVSVDAHTGEVLAIEDKNQYLSATIKGSVYPMTSTEVCPNNEQCGTAQLNYPMPWADTGFASPNNYTNAAGVYNYTSGTATTKLNGKYVYISDKCGSISVTSSTGNVAMGGTNGQHDCTSATSSLGNTFASRSAFYELNKLAEQARGWLPTNTWLQGKLTANVNIASTCNAYWNGSSVNFYRSGGGCRNTGEVAAVFDHEWGHGLDDFDANGVLSSSAEAYADIAAIYRLQTSCVGHGFFSTSNKGCGMTADGTGYNQNEAQSGAAHCNTDCSGVRDADWAKHSDNTPDTPQNFVCTKCSSSTGPCGRQVHCAAAPTRQAAWDLVARDLRAAPFNYDSNTAFIIGNKLFYQGSGNVGSWHSCSCTSGTSDGCGATNGYTQWITADDDNGNLNDGTPHMTAIHAAFARHNIACTTPAPKNAGCATGPSVAPSMSPMPSPSPGTVQVSWGGVSGAANYWVMKTEGHAGCNFGKAKVATVTGTSYTDTAVASGRQYCYSVVAAGSNSACYSPASTCTCAYAP